MHTIWREVDGHQAQLDAIEQLTPFEIRQAGTVLANLQTAWQAATPDEQREICGIILDKIVYEFALGNIAKITPKPEYNVLFKKKRFSMNRLSDIV